MKNKELIKIFNTTLREIILFLLIMVINGLICIDSDIGLNTSAREVKEKGEWRRCQKWKWISFLNPFTWQLIQTKGLNILTERFALCTNIYVNLFLFISNLFLFVGSWVSWTAIGTTISRDEEWKWYKHSRGYKFCCFRRNSNGCIFFWRKRNWCNLKHLSKRSVGLVQGNSALSLQHIFK